MSKPTFDRSRNHGDVMHGVVPDGVSVSALPRYIQDGHYFLGDGTYHSSEDWALKALKKSAAAPSVVAAVTAPANTLPGVEEKDVENLLKDPRAEQLLELPRDVIISLVNAANGPMYAGEGSTKLMVAWLVQNTMGAVPQAPPPPPPAPTPIRTVVPDEQPPANADSDVL